MIFHHIQRYRQQAAQHIHYDVPLSTFCFFPPSIPRFSLAATVFTLWESMIAYPKMAKPKVMNLYSQADKAEVK